MSRHTEFVPAIKQQLLDIFGFNVSATKISGGVEIDAGSSCTVTFTMLTKLSKIFGTMKIDVNSQIISGGYCETCSYEETVVRIQIFEPTHDLNS